MDLPIIIIILTYLYRMTISVIETAINMDSHNITYERQPQHRDHPTLIRIVPADWDSWNVRSRFDVTALNLPGFSMRGREPLETRFWRGIKIRGFDQIKKILRQITPQNKLFLF